MLVIIKSLIITALISLGFSFSLKQVFGFWEMFVLAFTVQFIVGFLWKTFNLKKTNAIIEELSNDLEEILIRQQAVVECPCGKNTISVVILPNEDITTQCEKCNNTFRVITDIKTQLVTEPVNMESVFDKLKELPYNKV